MWHPIDRDGWAEAHNVELEIATAIFHFADNAADAAEMASDCDPDSAPAIVRMAQGIRNKAYRFAGAYWAALPTETAARAKIRRDLAAAVHVLQGSPSADELSAIIRNLVEAEHVLRYLRQGAAA